MKHTPKPVHLVLVGNGKREPFVGVYEVAGRLPELLRYPGESPDAFTLRALHLVQGEGPLWARLMYASDPPVRVPLGHFPHGYFRARNRASK